MHGKPRFVVSALILVFFSACNSRNAAQSDSAPSIARDPAQTAATRGSFFNGQVDVESERISVQSDITGTRQSLFLYRIHDRQHRVVCYSNGSTNFQCVPSSVP